MRTIDEFSELGFLAHSLNNAFISLILKVEGASDICDFRPISLMRSTYKIITKVMSRPMRKVFHKVVSQEQVAFIKERHIVDGILIANSVLIIGPSEVCRVFCAKWTLSKCTIMSVGSSWIIYRR